MSPATTPGGPATPAVAAPDALSAVVRRLAGDIGERHVWFPDKLNAAAEYLEAELRSAGFAVRRQGFEAEGRTVYNLEAELAGTERPGEVVVLGAHYDTFCGTHLPGGKAAQPGRPGRTTMAAGWPRCSP